MRLKGSLACALALALAACGGGDAPAPDPANDASDRTGEVGPTAVQALQLRVLDCGMIEISDLDVFSSAGDYAGQSGTFTDTCWLVEHPDGRLLWDLGLPGVLVEGPPQENGIFTVSLDTTLTEQLEEIGLTPDDIDLFTISHSHFDHIGQADQMTTATWLVHTDEYAAMFPPPPEEGEENSAPPDQTAQFAVFSGFEREKFEGEKDVFGDGSVIIFPTPGHTPGHTTLQVNLPETGPVLLSGDLYHRTESRELQRVPQFNYDEAMTRASMEAFEARAERLGAKVIIQHEMDDIEALPEVLK